MAQRYEVTPYDPQGRAHMSRILPTKEEAEELAQVMRRERRGTGWRYEVEPFPRRQDYRDGVLDQLDRLLSKAQDVIGSRISSAETRETDPTLYRFGNRAFDDIERIRRAMQKRTLKE